MTPSKNQDREARERLRRYTARQTVHARQVKRRSRDNLVGILGVVVVAALATGSQIAFTNGGPGTPTPSSSSSPKASATPTASSSASAAAGQNTGDVPAKSVAQDRLWNGTLTLNDDVKLGIQLNGKKAPQATAALVTLITDSWYDGKTCHRLSTGTNAKFLQCGSANGDGTGDDGFEFGPLENVPADSLYKKGVIAMARSSDPYSQSTQFFIVYGNTYLDASTGGYTVVGSITSGLSDLVSSIADKGLAAGTSGTDGAPAVATTITGATIK